MQVFWRCPEFATSTASSFEAAREFLLARPEVGVLCRFQCTAPFITPEIIEEGYEKIVNKGETLESYEVNQVTRDTSR